MAIPSRKWFPQNLQERAAWYANFNTQIQIVGASLGLTAADLTAISSDNSVNQFLASTATELDALRTHLRPLHSAQKLRTRRPTIRPDVYDRQSIGSCL